MSLCRVSETPTSEKIPAIGTSGLCTVIVTVSICTNRLSSSSTVDKASASISRWRIVETPDYGMGNPAYIVFLKTGREFALGCLTGAIYGSCQGDY